MAQKYLAHKRKISHAVHLWDGRDTLCRMWSTGGLNPKNYQTTDRFSGLVCQLCAARQKTTNDFPADQSIAGVLAWAADMFGPVALEHDERMVRFIEEAIELAHAFGIGRHKMQALVDRVWSCERGDVCKEAAQANITLRAFAENAAIDLDVQTEMEIQRIMAIPKEEWQRRHAAKVKLGIAAE